MQETQKNNKKIKDLSPVSYSYDKTGAIKLPETPKKEYRAFLAQATKRNHIDTLGPIIPLDFS